MIDGKLIFRSIYFNNGVTSYSTLW